VYTEFESDEHGNYTYFIGEVVNSIKDQDLSRFKIINVPKSNYVKFTTPPGKMPEVIISAWQKIWAMKMSDFGGKRNYVADFEVYDERAIDSNNSTVDIYIGIEN
jgi:predicted transcriptional regulator YdeE